MTAACTRRRSCTRRFLAPAASAPRTRGGICLALPGEVFEFGCRLCPRTPRLDYPAALKLAGYALARFRDGKRRVTASSCHLPQ
jgi:hypothetical protein